MRYDLTADSRRGKDHPCVCLPHFLVNFSSVVIDYLHKRCSQNNETVVACIYFQYKDKLSPAAILCSLLKQLVQEQLSLSNELHDLYCKHEKRQTKLGVKEASNLLTLETTQISKFFVVLDALDECLEDENARGILLAELKKLPNLQLMITGRPHVAKALSRFGDLRTLRVVATGKDILRYIQNQIETYEFLSDWVQMDSSFKDRISNAVLSKADGM